MHYFRGLILTFVLFNLMPAYAETADSLRKKAVDYMQANKNLVATEIDSHYVFSGDDPIEGTYKTHISAWKAGEPIRTLFEPTEASKEAFKARNFDFDIASRFASHPDELIRPTYSVSLLEEQVLFEKSWAVLQISSPTSDYRAKLWLDPKTGGPLKIEGSLEHLPVPGLKTVAFSVLYEDDQNGRKLPAEILINYTFSILFRTANISFKQAISMWGAKP